jgi:small-conductance mechanosensitive channel
MFSDDQKIAVITPQLVRSMTSSIQWSPMNKGIHTAAKHTLKTEWFMGITAAVIALAAIGLGRAFGKIERSSLHQKLYGWAAAVVLVIAGAYAIIHLSRAIGRLVTRQSNPGAGATIRLVTNGLGYVLLIFALLTVLGVSLDHLLIGAGVAGIILGVAAQQSLGNVFAAIVMLFARPFVVGDNIRIRSGVTGVLDVKVLGTGLTYVTVMTDDGVLRVPNSIMLGAGIGHLKQGATPIPSPAPWAPPNPTTPDSAASTPAPTPSPAPSAAPAPSASPSATGQDATNAGMPPGAPTL